VFPAKAGPKECLLSRLLPDYLPTKLIFGGNGIVIPFKESSKSVTPRLAPQGVTDFKNYSL